MRRLLAVALLFTSASALAQEEEASGPLSTISAEDQKKTVLNPVEHGFFLGVETGVQVYFKTPGYNLSPGGSAGSAAAVSPGINLGQSIGVELGFEPAPIFAIGLVAWGGSAGTSSEYLGTQISPGNLTPTSTTPSSGNLTTLLLGVDARLNLSLGENANGDRRTFFYIRAGGGYSLARPAGLISNEVVVFGGPGIEYFTRLRHFSIGLEAISTFGVSNGGFAEIVQPVVRYSF